MSRLSLIPSLVAILVAELILMVCLYIPYSSKVIPEWNVLVTDENGQPVANAPVQQSAAFFRLKEKWVETQRTDQRGRVSFPERSINASVMDRLLARAQSRDPRFPYGPLVAAWVCFRGQYAITDPQQFPDETGTVHLTIHPGICPSE